MEFEVELINFNTVAAGSGIAGRESGIVAYIGIGYSGDNSSFLREQVSLNGAWLKGDRLPRFFGDGFVVMYDSNTAREFVKKCKASADKNSITIYPMEQPIP